MKKWQWVLELVLILLFLTVSFSFAAKPPPYSLTEFITSGLVQPIDLQLAPGEKKFYVIEQAGRIRIIENGKVVKEPFLNIQSKVRSGGEMGLLGLTFHPNYQANKKFYVNYTTEDPTLRTVIAEYVAGLPTERVLLTYNQPYVNHNGGALAFDKEGNLYIGVGDGGNRADPHNYGQNKNVLLGKILRISPDGSPYTIPKDNPFANGGGRPEVFAYGMRNPWKISFDRLTGALFAADVGQDAFEEIDIIEKGGNYGWRFTEGSHCFEPEKNCPKKGLIDPIHEYPRSEGISITGGYVYRGKKIPSLTGAYIYADFGSGKIWALFYNQSKKKVEKNIQLMKTDLPIASFGQDHDGEILVLSHDGRIFYLKGPTSSG